MARPMRCHYDNIPPMGLCIN
ncbi:hypothetical protein BCEP4_410046 [Burkholderia cepacia]|nr:hypothetical protein BCEP4_410046 [Burkholderia cepacia]